MQNDKNNTMKAFQVTAEFVKNHEVRNYNPQEWDKIINRLLTYSDCQFFHVPTTQNTLDSFYAEYITDDGLRLFREVDYASCMTNGGFYELVKNPILEDGRSNTTFAELMKDGEHEKAMELCEKLNDATTFEIYTRKFTNLQTGKSSVVGTSREARQWMIDRSDIMTFTKGL